MKKTKTSIKLFIFICICVLIIFITLFSLNSKEKTSCNIEDKTCINTEILKKNKMILNPIDSFKDIEISNIYIENDYLTAKVKFTIAPEFYSLNELNIFYTEYPFKVTINPNTNESSVYPCDQLYKLDIKDQEESEILIKEKITKDIQNSLLSNEDEFFSISLSFKSPKGENEQIHEQSFVFPKQEINNKNK